MKRTGVSVRRLSDCLALSTLLTIAGCGRASSDSDAGSDAPASDGITNPLRCASDPLRTGLLTPPDIDTYDCEILQYTRQSNEPDAMIFKAMIYIESRFHFDAAACPNMPCGTPAGWSTPETQCFGLMQIVPACGGSLVSSSLLPNGHPDMSLDRSSPAWAGSVFNPSINIQIGIAGIADNRRQLMAQFPGCTQDQYTLMAIGNYNSYGSTHGCDRYNMAYDTEVLTAYRQYATASGWPAHAY